MREEVVGEAIAEVAWTRVKREPDWMHTTITADVAHIIYEFLTRLLRGANWWERQLIRTVRGYVRSWIVKHGYRDPEVEHG